MSNRSSLSLGQDDKGDPGDPEAPEGPRTAPSVADIAKYIEDRRDSQDARNSQDSKDVRNSQESREEPGRKSLVVFNDELEVKHIDDTLSQRTSLGEQSDRPPPGSNRTTPANSAPGSARNSVDSQWVTDLQQQITAYPVNFDYSDKQSEGGRSRSPSVGTNTGDQRSRPNSITPASRGNSITQASRPNSTTQASRANSVGQASQAGDDARSDGRDIATSLVNSPSELFGFGTDKTPSQVFGQGYNRSNSTPSQAPGPSNYEDSTTEKTYKMRKSGDFGSSPSMGGGGGGGAPAVQDTRSEKEWMTKFEQFAIKFLNKIFWRARTERRLTEAVKFPSSCKKKPAGFVPTANAGVYPYSTFAPLAGFEESKVTDAAVTNAEEEATMASELNAMLDEIKQVITTFSSNYLPQVTQIFQVHLMGLRNRDFRETDNREIYRRIDDYATLIRCDSHICTETVKSRLEALLEFLNAVQKDTETLKKFPRILTKCYSTESKICQEVCEVYSDNEFQTVNIKKMCKLKCKQPERPPWRLTYKIGRECYPGYDAKMQAQTAPCPPVKQCCASGPTCGAGPSCSAPGPSNCAAGPSCGARSNTCGGGNCGGGNSLYKADLNSCGDRIVITGEGCGCGPSCAGKKKNVCGRRRRKTCRTSRRRRECPCGCVDSKDFIPDICGILYTRFRALDIDNTPMMVEGHGTEQNFPSTTDFKSIRELDIPNQKLFSCEPKCDNPIPCHARDNCFGTGGYGKWKNKQYPCGAKNNCRRESCKTRRDPKTCCTGGKRKKKKKKQAECGTSMTNLPGIGRLRVPPGLGHQEFKAIMTDFYGTLTERGGYNVVGSGANRNGYNMGGIVGTQTMSQQQQLNRPPPPEKLEQELKTKQLADRSKFEDFLKTQREDFAEQQRKLWNGFEEYQRTLPFEMIQEHRLQFDQEMSDKRQKFEESILQQWKDFNAKQEQERKDMEARIANGAAMGPGPAPGPSNWQVQDQDPQSGRYNFTQMNVQTVGNMEMGFQNIGLNKEAFVQHGQQTQAGFMGRIQAGGGPVLSSKQQQTFRPYEQFQPVTGDELQAELERCLQVPNNTLTGCLAKLAPTGDGPADFSTKQKEEVYMGFIAQMLAAGNITKADADKMQNLVKSKLQMERMETRGPSGSNRGGRQNQKEAQCTLANTCPARPKYAQDSRFMHVCQDGDGCPHGTTRGFSTPPKVYTQTKTYTTSDRCDLQQTRGWQNTDGSYGTGVLCLSTAKEGTCPMACPVPIQPPTCDGPRRPPVKSKSHSFVKPKPSAPLCAVKSYPMVFKSPQCPKQNYDYTRPPCCAFSKPKVPFLEKCTPKTTMVPVVASKLSIPEEPPPPPPPPFRDPSPPSGQGVSNKSSGSERSLSLTSLSPSPPTSAHEASGEDTQTSKTPSTKKKPYKSPFQFKKQGAPQVDCDTSFARLPECHPLKTPYPPQYRFDEVRMRRYQEQCHLLKQICAHAPGEQCWTPPPPPLPPELRERPPPFPPDPCAPNLFPQAGLGMGCGYGLSAGSCYGPFGNKRTQKPEECFFDCGGICPMACEPKVPVYSKLKKKKKEDEFFCFDYITVMREKNPKQEPEKDYCDLYRQRKEMQKQNQCPGGLPTLEIEVEGQRGRRGRRGRPDDNCNLPPLPNDEITRFLLRPDVQLVKEQKTEIVKKHGCEGPEKMVSQIEAYYTKTNDGRITTEIKDLSNDPNANSAVDQWIKQDGEATLRKLNRARNCGEDCPIRDTDWEKEFKEFAKSCRRPKRKPRGPNLKPMPAGFIPCPLPDAPAPIMCRVEDPNNLSGGGPTIQCQAIPFPLSNLIGNTAGPDGRCPYTLTVPPFGMPPPPGAYGGYAMQQPMMGAMGQSQNQGNQGQFPPGYPINGGAASNFGGGWSNADPGPNGTARFDPSQPVKSVLRMSSQSQKSSLKRKERKSDDYPYMCEIKYHEPIQGSIYGRVVSRKQPCRLIDPDSGIPPNHNPECPVIMETPYFNPSCPQKGNSQSLTKAEDNKENR